MLINVRFVASVVCLGMISCTPPQEFCPANYATAELELVAARRFNVGLDPSSPEVRTDTVQLTLIRNRTSGDTVFGTAVGPLTDLGVVVGPDAGRQRPYHAHCRRDSLFIRLDPRIVDMELHIRGTRSVPSTGIWETATYNPFVQGEFTLLPDTLAPNR